MKVGENKNQHSCDHQFPRVGFNSCGGGSGIMYFSLSTCIFVIFLFLSGSTLMITNATMFYGSSSNIGNEIYPKRVANLHSDLHYNQLSRALERIHFGPLLRLRSISNRAAPRQFQFASELAPTNRREKKALSYLSRFYHPVLQSSHSSIHGGSFLSSPKMKVYYGQHHSGETMTHPVGRNPRPIMRLRWGK